MRADGSSAERGENQMEDTDCQDVNSRIWLSGSQTRTSRRNQLAGAVHSTPYYIAGAGGCRTGVRTEAI
ncbi:hypothetical protein N657DRAFT_221344 [Parathielavia appendiculata]|uniref:Uncharacterized protein n=1 Tax=Parathielavia appendiculata TaxID=2587402 RepID=A0AAN6Z7A1_9PEZI|nr:hypothetical protein N657DRAFT_221344 [Parathielavia appendiculata]